MACSCRSIALSSSSGTSRSCYSSSASSSGPISLSFHRRHHRHRLFCTVKPDLLPLPDCKDSTKQFSFSCFVTTSKQGHTDKSTKGSQRGSTGGGRGRSYRSGGAALEVKDERTTNKKGGNSSRNFRSYNTRSNNRRFNDDVEDENGRNPRSYNTSNSPRSFSTSTSSKAGSRRDMFSDEDGEEAEEEDDDETEDYDDEDESEEEGFRSQLAVLPVPPAGFVLSENGNVSLMAPPNKRVITMVDPENKLSLECLIRRVFSSSDGRQCFLLCPLDTPVQILRIEGDDDVLKEITDEELEDVFPTASYELAKRLLHMVKSGFCLTLRGRFCYSEDDVIDLNTVYGESGGDSLHEGVEIASFELNGSEYLIFTPLDPLMFVSYKDDETGELMLAKDELLDDEAVQDAIDEENEFQAYMEEEEEILVRDDEESD